MIGKRQTKLERVSHAHAVAILENVVWQERVQVHVAGLAERVAPRDLSESRLKKLLG